MASEPLLGGVVLAGAAVGYGLLLEGVRRLGRAGGPAEPVAERWWYGYARDAANLAGLLAIVLGFRALGYPGPLALLAGLTFALAAYSLDFALARRLAGRRPTVAFAAVAVVLAVAVALLRVELADGLRALLDALFAGETAA